MQSSERLLIRALRREAVPRAPVWLMRQAGRYLPEYRDVRARAGGFLEMVKDPALAAEVTLQPVRRFGMDAAILFSDILMPLEAMGMPLLFDERGPVLPEPLREARHVDALEVVDPAATMGFVGDALQLVRAGLPERTALVGFCGAPFTLASYAVEGGTSRNYAHLRRLMYHDTPLFERLLDKLAVQVARHLDYQAACGAEALVLFDTWAASLTREDYLRCALPWTKRVLATCTRGVPRVLFGGAADHLLEDLAGAGAEGVAIDHRSDLAAAFERTGGRLAVQGNLDPGALFAPPAEVARRTHALLASVAGRRGHVLNLGHGVMKETDPECVGAFVRAALEHGGGARG
jgi:uroporphyrinogen decarboxylase